MRPAQEHARHEARQNLHHRRRAPHQRASESWNAVADCPPTTPTADNGPNTQTHLSQQHPHEFVNRPGSIRHEARCTLPRTRCMPHNTWNATAIICTPHLVFDHNAKTHCRLRRRRKKVFPTSFANVLSSTSRTLQQQRPLLIQCRVDTNINRVRI